MELSPLKNDMFSAALSGAAVFVDILDKNRKLCYTYDSLNRVTKRTTKNLSNVVLSEESYSYGMDYAMAYVLSEEVNTVSYIFLKMNTDYNP